MEQEIEQKIAGQRDKISRQLQKIQTSLDKLADQHRRQEPGLVQGLRETRLKARQ
jgi:hypothetical protein